MENILHSRQPYGSLVGGLAEQLALFNSLPGVRPDHGSEVKSILTTDEQSGQKVRCNFEGRPQNQSTIILLDSFVHSA